MEPSDNDRRIASEIRERRVVVKASDGEYRIVVDEDNKRIVFCLVNVDVDSEEAFIVESSIIMSWELTESKKVINADIRSLAASCCAAAVIVKNDARIYG